MFKDILYAAAVRAPSVHMCAVRGNAPTSLDSQRIGSPEDPSGLGSTHPCAYIQPLPCARARRAMKILCAIICATLLIGLAHIHARYGTLPQDLVDALPPTACHARMRTTYAITLYCAM